MGVRGLEYYLENCEPNWCCCYEVDIQELARKYRKSRPENKEPVIVVDGANALRGTLYRDSRKEYDDCWVLGGQMNEMVDRMQKFVSSFQQIGIRIVFFFNGATSEENRELWLNRRKSNIAKVTQVFKNIRNGYGYQRQHCIPPLVGATARYASSFECECETHISLRDDDYELAEYARENDCFAILSQDTDFLFHKGANHYLSLKNLNLENMTTVKYDMEGFKNRTGLYEDHEMLLLATLLGNDIVSSEKLENFHKKLVSNHTTDINTLLPAVVEYIKQQKFPYDEEFEYLPKLARDIFNDESMAKDLKRSIRSYLPSFEEADGNDTKNLKIWDGNWAKILQLAKERHMTGVVTPHMYPVMIGDAYELSIALEPYHERRFISTAEIYLPLRERIYAILLHEKPQTSPVKEWCVSGEVLSEVPALVDFSESTDFLANVHPGLLNLWHDECPPENRWLVFAEALNARRRVNARKLKSLGLPLAIPVAVLLYLFEENRYKLDDYEIDAFLVHSVLLESYARQNKLNEISVDLKNSYNLKRFIEVSTIFHRGISTILFLLSACGFPLREAMPWFYFDGKLLYKKYSQAFRNEWNFLNEMKEKECQTFRRMVELVTAASPRN